MLPITIATIEPTGIFEEWLAPGVAVGFPLEEPLVMATAELTAAAMVRAAGMSRTVVATWRFQELGSLKKVVSTTAAMFAAPHPY